MRNDPKKKTETGAKDEAGDDRKVEGGVFAAVDDVAREAAEAQGELAAEVKERAEEDQEDAKNEEHTAEFAEGIHEKHSSGTADPGQGTIEERFLRSAGRRTLGADARTARSGRTTT